jgi:hypothetical protein
MSVGAGFRAVSEAAEGSLNLLAFAGFLLGQGKDSEARKVLKQVSDLAFSDEATAISQAHEDLNRVADGRVRVDRDYFASAHEAVAFIWITVRLLIGKHKRKLPANLIERFGVTNGRLLAQLCSERARLLPGLTGKPGIRPTDAERMARVLKVVQELFAQHGKHASAKTIIKTMKAQNIGQRPVTTRRILRKLEAEGLYQIRGK